MANVGTRGRTGPAPVSVPWSDRVVYPYWKRLIVEALGTFGFFFFGFSGIAAAVLLPGSIGSAGVAAGFGLGLALMIFAFGHISGGHFNPAVSLGLATGRQFPWGEMVGYWIAQLAGAFCAMGAAYAVYSSTVQDYLVTQPGKGIGTGTAVALEIIFTALFVIVISAVATDKAPWSGVFAPIAIGGFIFTAATVVGPISGGSFNPARSIAPAIYAQDATTLWIYIVGPLLGGAIGGGVYWLIRSLRGPGEVQELSER